MNIDKYLEHTNSFLSKNYGEKHTNITIDDITKVYNRSSILSINADSKTTKGTKLGYLTGILYLAPSKMVGFNTCPFASAGCKKSCLYTAGRGKFYSVTKARMIKTLAFLYDKAKFYAVLEKSIKKLINKANKENAIPCVRLNGTSDLVFEKIYPELFKTFSNLQFYDYTKNYVRFYAKLPENLHLTYSLAETTESAKRAKALLARGHNVAAVFRSTIPNTFFGYEVTSGDDTDLRFLDKEGTIVGLKAKGLAKKDDTGFVIDLVA